MSRRSNILKWCFDDADVLDATLVPNTQILNTTYTNSNVTTPLRKSERIFTDKTKSNMYHTNTIGHRIIHQAEREQALRDYKVTIEYKHLKLHAPGGVYIVPSMDSLRKFYGVIFVRRGPFTNGIFKFTLDLPTQYNDINTHPIVTFTSHVYNPYVDANTGILDIKTAYPRWDPTKHYLVTILTYLKKIFYAKTFDEATANLEAKELAQTNPTAFTTKINQCVRDSQNAIYDTDETSTSTIRFTEETLCHRVFRDLLKENVRVPDTVSKNLILTTIEKASKV